MPEEELVVGDIVEHLATGEVGVVEEIIDAEHVKISYGYNKRCTCHVDAVEKQ